MAIILDVSGIQFECISTFWANKITPGKLKKISKDFE